LSYTLKYLSLNLHLKLINGHLLSIYGAAPGPYLVRINAVSRPYLAGAVSYDNIVSEYYNNRELIATLIPLFPVSCLQSSVSFLRFLIAIVLCIYYVASVAGLLLYSSIIPNTSLNIYTLRTISVLRSK